MIIIVSLISSLLWRIHGGLWKKYIPAHKIWYGVFFAMLSYWIYGASLPLGFITCYLSYQLYGWGLYIGRLILGTPINPESDKECELIDNLLYPLHVTLKGNAYYLYQYPRLFGFCGTTLTGLIITFLWGIYLNNFMIVCSGAVMGICYYLGCLVNKIFPEAKAGWGYGEFIFGAVIGVLLMI